MTPKPDDALAIVEAVRLSSERRERIFLTYTDGTIGPLVAKGARELNATDRLWASIHADLFYTDIPSPL